MDVYLNIGLTPQVQSPLLEFALEVDSILHLVFSPFKTPFLEMDFHNDHKKLSKESRILMLLVG